MSVGVATQSLKKSSTSNRAFRIGRVKAFLRGKVWYLRYHENGARRCPRVGREREAAKQLAAQINGQLEVGAPSALSFEPIAIALLRDRWLEHHEFVLRSSLATIRRYRAATDHLLGFVASECSAKLASQFTVHHAEAFVRCLRTKQVAPNGHAKAKRRTLRDKGVKHILEICRAMFTYAGRRRHMPPYAENPFKLLDLDRLPIEDAKPIVLLTKDDERRSFDLCDEWSFPIFLSLALTGVRPGELTHILVAEDLDLTAGILNIRNKRDLGWQVKTRSERTIPLHPTLVEVLRIHLGDRAGGLLFRRPEFNPAAKLACTSQTELKAALDDRIRRAEETADQPLTRNERQRIADRLWLEAGLVKNDQLRIAFIRLTQKIGRPDCTAPKLFRHMFATTLQEGNVDPMIRCELMGHATGASTGLGMTGVYTHSRLETKRAQLESALTSRQAREVAEERLRNRTSGSHVAKPADSGAPDATYCVGL